MWGESALCRQAKLMFPPDCRRRHVGKSNLCRRAQMKSKPRGIFGPTFAWLVGDGSTPGYENQLQVHQLLDSMEVSNAPACFFFSSSS